MNNPPTHIYTEPHRAPKPMKPITVIKLQKKTVETMKYGCILGVLFTVLFIISKFNPTNWNSLFAVDLILPVTLALISIHFLWMFLQNKLVWKIDILPNKIVNRTIHHKLNIQTVALILAVPFVFMILLQVWTAMMSGTGFTVVYYDYFSEGWLEVILFTIVGSVVLIGAIVSFKKIRA